MSEAEELRERLENVKRLFIAGDLSTEEARELDTFLRRQLIGIEGFPHPPGLGAFQPSHDRT